VAVFREWLTDNERYGHGHEERRQRLLARLPELRGKDLACFCPPGRPCHAEHHQPRPDGKLPREEGGTCWLTPKQIAAAALAAGRENGGQQA
jgi:hypothetical protein